MLKPVTLLAILILSCSPSGRKQPPQAIKGVLDLRTGLATSAHSEDYGIAQGAAPDSHAEVPALSPWNFEKDGIMNLDGEWEFYWQEFVEPGSGIPESFINVPGSWKGYNTGTTEKPNSVGGTGYATYKLKLLLHRESGGIPDEKNIRSQKSDYAILLPTIGTAYRLYINNELKLSVGEAGINPENSRSAYHTQTLTLPPDYSGEYELVFHISDFNYNFGGLWYPIQIGTVNQINNLREQNLFKDFFLAGSLFIMGLYHFGLFWVRRKEKSTLWFGLICLLISIRTMIVGEYTAYNFLPGLPFEPGIKIEYLTWLLGVPFSVLFISDIFPEESSGKIINLIERIFYLSATLVVLFPLRLYVNIALPMKILTLMVLAYVLYILYRSIRKRRDGTIPFFIGTIILTATMINDILYSYLLIQTGFYISFGFFTFIFIQSFFLSTRFIRSFAQVEELSATLEQKVISRTEQLELARKKAEEANVLKDKFVGLISHDIRSPLSGVYSLIRIVGDMDFERDKQEIRHILSTCENSLGASLIMVEQILDLKRVQSGKIIPLYEKINLSSVLLSAIAKLSYKIEEKNIKLKNNSPDYQLYADPVLLGQILLNLISNAVKFCKPGDTIEISYKQVNNSHILSITDSGKGIPENILSSLFDPNIRTTSKGTKGETGTGLGLPLTRELVLAMKGHITVQSVLDQGSEFSVYLPAFDKIILAVDDEEQNRKNLQDILQNEKIVIQEAENGEMALKFLERCTPDIIITDINMPVMDGFVLIKKIREKNELKNIPVIVATSGILENDSYMKINSSLLLALGANEVLDKSSDREKYMTTIRKYLN